MDVPELSVLIKATQELKLEQQFSLGEGTLDSSEYRKPLNSAVDAAVAGEDTSEESNSAQIPPKSVAGQKRKKKSKDAGPSPKPTKRPGKAHSKGKGAEGKVKKATNVKSKEEVVSDSESEAATRTKEAPVASPAVNSRKRRKIVVNSEAEDGSEGESDNTVEVKETPIIGEGGEKVGSLAPEASSETMKEDEKSESEMSVLIDEPPKSRTKSKKALPEEKKKRGKKAAVTLSKDEETIKRLKSLVLACGIRKVWSKVFHGLDQPSQQIKKLKEILSELGMTGRMSLEQAKAIREKRELEQEIQDVQTFEKAVLKQGRSRVRVEESSDDEKQSSEEEKPVKRRGNARQSIMAFLQDQSDSD
ncbi:hypothetical protein AX16_008114 [Volvariella volvacea WC 439]|nr:hypothetical protein AX16_008114 [Volvariella volvacea WC 439]